MESARRSPTGEPQPAPIDRTQLEKMLRDAPPNNEDPFVGYALVNVLPRDEFEEEHIPGSINIPQGQEDRFEDRCDRGKEIVVYCASPECDASPKVADELVRRGFRRVVDYRAGTSDWKRRGHPVEGRAA